ncbi:hypothetical protein ACFWA9_27025 [Kitasatospora sp. NPDC059973]|uniref:hypothetical protein n=1 Tax=Kitasatospora sp. NPDC059973 TaxID=3347020 RepID=UPI0036C09985
MGTSSRGGPGGRRVVGYLESTRNLVGCGGGAVGLGLHFAGLGGAWWPGIVAALYVVGVLLAPGPRPVAPGRGRVPDVRVPNVPLPDVPVPAPPVRWVELDALAGYLGTVALPSSVKLDDLVERLRVVGPGPVAERIVLRRLPVAVDGYLRARTWERWTPDGEDPGVALAREVERMAAVLAG